MEALELADASFDARFNEPLVHQVVTAYLAGAAQARRRRRTAPTCAAAAEALEAEGHGRARVGTIRSPIWVGGGRTFAARPRSFEQKVNRKMYRGALRSMVSELLRQDRLLVTSELSVSRTENEGAQGQARSRSSSRRV